MRVGEVLTAGGARLAVHLEASMVVISVQAAGGSVQGALVLDADQSTALAGLLAEAVTLRA